MAADAQWPLQQAVFAALDADATLNGYVADRIYDHVPASDDPTLPYVVIGPGEAREWDAQVLDGMEHDVHVHVWSRYRGSKQAKQIQAAILDALDGASLSVTGHTLVLLRYEFSTVFPEPDGLTLHGVQRFRAITHA